ncbi:hypothetical protein IEQ34_005856 [Dendrobium chrysotoxum]|uniref:Uncharacterized protein n=1 Tax=Dendrobium chrysotoxum TaxID=161865 RepID=A0AAV7HE75_DENCH|nr:hypothetical protein IEQ34_005856 [Dendrobium chrysotoxum]
MVDQAAFYLVGIRVLISDVATICSQMFVKKKLGNLIRHVWFAVEVEELIVSTVKEEVSFPSIAIIFTFKLNLCYKLYGPILLLKLLAGRTNHVNLVMLPKGEWPRWCKACGGSGLDYCNRCLGTGSTETSWAFIHENGHQLITALNRRM